MKTKEELLARLADIKTRVGEIDQQFAGSYIDPASSDGQEWNSLNTEYDDTTKIVKQMEARENRIAELAKDPANTDEGAGFLTARPGAVRGGDIYDLSTIRSTAASPEQARAELHDRAKRSIDVARFPHDRADQAACKTHVEKLLAMDDEHGSLARRLLVTGSPVYQRAFGKALGGGGALHGSEFSALSLGVDGGGYAVPYTLDPTVIPTSDLAVNPYRAISRSVQLVGSNQWKGVSSGGVVATRRTESSESDDNSPTLLQPEVTVTRVDVFIPFSIELEQDWGAMQTELARMIQDAKDVEEAESFTIGTGVDPNPPGLLTGATETVTAGGVASFSSTDLDDMETALGPRFQQRAQWVGNRSIYNLTRHFATNNGPDLWIRIAEGLEHGGNTGRTLLGYRANEASAMPATHATADKFLVLGDFSYFLIVDRIGMAIELVQHLFGANRRPTGERGFFAYWRNNCLVTSEEAFVVLVAG